MMPESFHCKTCGTNYESNISYDGEGRPSLDNPHKCPLPQFTFFIETKTEYQWFEGKLFSRQVTFRRYSGHDVCGYPTGKFEPVADAPEGAR